jgi:hypothetical protein
MFKIGGRHFTQGARLWTMKLFHSIRFFRNRKPLLLRGELWTCAMLSKPPWARRPQENKMREMEVVLVLSIIVTLACVSGESMFASQRQEGMADTWSKVVPAEDTEVFEKILEFRRRKEFDSAVEIALKGVGRKPPDDFLLQTVADTYFLRSQAEPTQRERWVGLAVQYSEKATQENPGDIVNVFNLGERYLAAAMNLQKPAGCSYYAKSLEVFERLRADPALKGKVAVIEGNEVLLEPFRQKLDGEIKQARLIASGCPHPVDE